jgi:Leucine-rich repeat (LRR) protein
MTTNTEYRDEIYIYIGGATDVTINWGDGASESKTYDSDSLYYSDGFPVFHNYEHIYSKRTDHTVTITGNNITHLYCSHINLTHLDISLNTALTELDCTGNSLTYLDVSNNIALTNFGGVLKSMIH